MLACIEQKSGVDFILFYLMEIGRENTGLAIDGRDMLNWPELGAIAQSVRAADS